MIDKLGPKTLRESLLFTHPELNATAMIVACKAGNFPMIELLVQAASDLNSKVKGCEAFSPSSIAQVTFANSHYNLCSLLLLQQ